MEEVSFTDGKIYVRGKLLQEKLGKEQIVSQDYFFDGTNRKSRYYHQIAVNTTVEAMTMAKMEFYL